MHKALRLKGIQFDIVIAYREGGDYSRNKYTAITGSVRNCGCEYLIGGRGGVHIVNLGMQPDETRILLVSSACHIAESSLKRLPVEPFSAAYFRPTSPITSSAASVRTYGGGFEDKSFVISHTGENPPAPWCNIIASETFGTLVSDRSLGFSWAVNARENKLTPWSNDTVADNRGEMLIVKMGRRLYDVCLNAKTTYMQNATTYESEVDGVSFCVTVTIAGDFMAKLVTLEVENRRDQNVEIEAAYYTEPVLGVGTSTRRHIAINRAGGAAIIRNPWSQVTGCGFITALEGMDKFVYSREGFLSGSWKNGGQSVSPDPCAAAIVKRHLPPHRREKVNFVLGFAGNEAAAVKTVELLKANMPAIPAPRSVIKVKTPDERLNVMINTWLASQFMGSRIKGRTGFYQCGGAYGFRDQLQDCCAALFVEPQIAKAHIYRSAAHQFKEGDVMHWWHQLPLKDGGSKGVRTRCSDDMLWLPYTVCEYLEKTGDYTIFDHDVYYLEGAELDRSEEDRYFVPTRSGEKENVYLHCLRAIARAMTKGDHGLPLFGCGDWNDGMNLVGIGGKGESVWLAMFEALVLDRFAPVCRHMNDETHAAQYEEEAKRLRAAIDETCWDGQWYARGFFDDGHPLGVSENSECRIDFLPQSFAAIAGMPDGERRRTALDSAMKILVDEKLGVVRLFDPPFDKGGRNPGYIRSYPPGIRENGGQYTHAAVWGALGLLVEGRADEAYKILSYINPAQRTKSREEALTYRLEPYAITADIYTNPACEGRGGWSLYTGAAGWYYRTVVEYLLGIKISADKVTLAPCLPTDWPGFEASIELRGTSINIKVTRGDNKALTVDGARANYIPLDGKKHEARLVI
jgi:cyclic beta-1,2-glucan synthetase